MFDAHIHYNRPDWDVLSPEQILAILDRAGVRRALVSSIPDDGTLMLYEKAPDRIVPFLRPYRTRKDIRSWHRNPELQSYLEERLRRGIYKGIGEIDLLAEYVDVPVFKGLVELAAQRQLFLHVDADNVAVEKLLHLHPQVRILWADGARFASRTTVGRLLEQFPNVWVELAQRSDVAPGGMLDPEWRALFLQHAGRFMVGSSSNPKSTLLKFMNFLFHSNRFFIVVTDPWGTWVTSRWERLVDDMRASRAWLGQLPSDVAEQIAYQNAEQLFGRLPEQPPSYRQRQAE